MAYDINFFLFCKSYLGDLNRVELLWNSVKKFNKDLIPFYISVPSKDLDLFRSRIRDDSGILHWISDEEIVLSNPGATLEAYKSWDGRLSQQVIKSEFWRIFAAKNYDVTYLCLDSECIFIRNFGYEDFLNSDGVPYTVIHQNRELLQIARLKSVNRVLRHFYDESEMLKKIFSRKGVDYDFGPTPVIWSSKVWMDLDSKYLKPKNMTLWDAINQSPSELRWYGEALLFFKSIPLNPIEPLFRVYHYDWQYFHLKKMGESLSNISFQYMGVLSQSNWNYELDYGSHAKRKSWLSKMVRCLKRWLSRFR